jgi:hypothetical protein
VPDFGGATDAGAQSDPVQAEGQQQPADTASSKQLLTEVLQVNSYTKQCPRNQHRWLSMAWQQKPATADAWDVTLRCLPKLLVWWHCKNSSSVALCLQELQTGDTAPNAFAMTMLCCDPESQQKAASLALLAAAFDAFPDKDYCLLTLPPDSPELPLLATFTRLVPPPGSSLVEVLYLCHRFALLEDFQVSIYCLHLTFTSNKWTSCLMSSHIKAWCDKSGITVSVCCPVL